MEWKLQGSHRGKFKIRTGFTLGLFSLKEVVEEAKENEKKKKKLTVGTWKAESSAVCPFLWSSWQAKLLHMWTSAQAACLVPQQLHGSHGLSGPVRQCWRQTDQEILAGEEGRGKEMGEISPQPKPFYSSPCGSVHQLPRSHPGDRSVADMEPS